MRSLLALRDQIFPKIRETHKHFCIYTPAAIAITKKVKIKNCLIGLGLSVLTTTGLFLPAPAISEPMATKIIVAQARAERKRIAVLDFEFASTSSTGYYYGWLGIGPAKGVSDLLTNALVKDGTYIVLERSKVEQILKEQNFGASGRVDASTAAQIGKILGADAVIIGTITQFNLEKSRSGGSFLGISGGSSTDNTDTLLSTAAESAIAKMSGELVTANAKLATLPSVLPTASAIVADITGNSITINKGSESGFKSGMNLSIERVVKEVKDPQTGKVLRSITSPIGRVELIEVSNGYATGKIVSGSGFKVQDIAKPVQ